MKDRESPDVEQEDINPTPPYYRPRIRQTSQVMPELKVENNNRNFMQSSTTFFRNNSPVKIGACAGAAGAGTTWLLWSSSAMLYAIPPAIIAGIICLVGGSVSTFAYQQYEKCKNNSASKGPML